MNVSDTERASSRLSDSGFLIVDNESDADVVLLNTCAIREKAAHKVFTRIGEVSQSGKQRIVGVMGCVAQLEGAAIFEKNPIVDIVCGTGSIERLPGMVAGVLEKREKQLDLDDRIGDDWGLNYEMRHSKQVAFVPIIEGCNKFCTYCIVPYSRGRERSRAASSVISEVLALKDKGVKEVVLIGQNVNSYRPLTGEGLEKVRGATPFSKLLRAVAATGIDRVKFTTSFPRDFHADIITAIEEHDNLCEWIHLPVQSGSDSVLKAMRRGYTSSFYLGIVERIRNSSRKISITTDIIVGFPGESDNDNLLTLDLLRKCDYEGAYIFKYSERKGTPAQFLEDSVPEEVKTERFLEIEEAQKDIQLRKYKRLLGQTLEVLVEKRSTKDATQLSGHTRCHKVVNFYGDDELVGKLVNVRMTEAKANCLVGELE
jgi:tRNA-2-methylthio-N6-dimethylallyladenosine synthase